MARKIAETPILYGQDAIDFERERIANEDKKLSTEEMTKILMSYWKLEAIRKDDDTIK